MDQLLLGRAEANDVHLLSALANRHGAITGATGGPSRRASRSVGSSLARELTRGILGSLSGGRRR
jgi:hypothetical protein